LISLYISKCLSKIPKAGLLLTGRLLGVAAYVLFAPHRKIVKRNFAFAYPEWSKNRIRRHAIAVFQHLCITVLEICQFFCFDKARILKKVRIKGDKQSIDMIKSNKQVIFISGHIGNWEVGPLLFACYFNRVLVLLARAMKPDFLNRQVNNMRSRYGNTVLDKMDSLSEMQRLLGGGQSLGLVIDQGTKISEGEEVVFLGHRVTATPVVALMARRYKCPVIPAFTVREADGELTIVYDPPLKFKRSKDIRADLRENTQIMMSVIEKAVRRYPEQWFWFNKRWKRFYPWLYPEYQDKRRRKRAREEKQQRKKIRWKKL